MATSKSTESMTSQFGMGVPPPNHEKLMSHASSVPGHDSFGGQVAAMLGATGPEYPGANRPGTAPMPGSMNQRLPAQQQQQQLLVNGLGQGASMTNPNDTAALRDEIRRLQLALVDKFRGRNKMTGGSQFRISNQRGKETDTKCKECAGLRNQVKGMKRECGELRNFGNELQKQLAAAARLRAEHEKQMADDTMAWGVERKSLLLQLQTQKQSDDKQTSPIFVEIEGDKTAEVQLLKKRIQEYEVSMMKAEREFKLCQAQAADDRVAFGKRETAWNAEKARLMAELDASRRRERKSSEASDRAADEALAELRESLRATEAVRDDYKDEVDQLRLDLIAKGDGHDSLLERVLQLEKHLHEEKEKHTATTTELSGKKAELVDLTRSLKTMASELEDRTVEAKAAQERCKAAEDGRSRAEEQLAAAKRAQETCERTIKTLEDTIERLRRQLVESNDDVEDLRRQLQVKTDALRQCSADRDKALIALDRARETLAEQEETFEAQMKMHKEALEAALNSVVRLCVVAPTVNVHMGELSLALSLPILLLSSHFHSRHADVFDSVQIAGDQTQTFKAPLPTNKLRGFVEQQVLPKFAKIFVQPTEGAAPNGEKLDQWLQGLLVEMQGTIERHLTKLFAQVKT